MPKVIALHGIQGTAQSCVAVAARLKESSDVLLPNMKGRGLAARECSPDDYSLGALAQDLYLYIASEVGQEPYVVAGWSLGVSVALEWVTSHCTRQPTGLILLSGTPCICNVRWFECNEGGLLQSVVDREHCLGLREVADHDAVALTCAAIRSTDQRGILSKVKVPTLVIHVSTDDDCPLEHGHLIASGIPGVRFVELQGIGHGVLTSAPDQVAEQIDDFIYELREARGLST